MSKKLKKLLKLAAVSGHLPLPATGPSEIGEPLAMVPAFVDAWNKGDADALAALFAEDADFVNVVGLWWTSRRSIRRAHAQGFEKIFPGSTIVAEKVALRQLNEEAAIVHVRWQLAGQVDPDGEPAELRRGVFSAVVQRLADGTWVCVSLQNTDIVPAADTNLAQGGRIAGASYLEGPDPRALAADSLESSGPS